MQSYKWTGYYSQDGGLPREWERARGEERPQHFWPVSALQAIKDHMRSINFNNYGNDEARLSSPSWRSSGRAATSPGDWNEETLGRWRAFVGKADLGALTQEMVKRRWAKHLQYAPGTSNRADELQPASSRFDGVFDELYGLFFHPAPGVDPAAHPQLRFTVEMAYVWPYLEMGAIAGRGVDYRAVHLTRMHRMKGVTPAQMATHMRERNSAMRRFLARGSERLSESDAGRFEPGAGADMVGLQGSLDADCERYMAVRAWTGYRKTDRTRAGDEPRYWYVPGVEFVEEGREQVLFGKMSSGDGAAVNVYHAHPQLRAYILFLSDAEKLPGIQWTLMLNQTVAACVVRGNGAEMLFPLRFVLQDPDEGFVGAEDAAGGNYDTALGAEHQRYLGALLFPVFNGPERAPDDAPGDVGCMVFPVFVFYDHGAALAHRRYVFYDYSGRKVEPGSVMRRKHGSYAEMNQLRCMAAEGGEWQGAGARAWLWKLEGAHLTPEARRHVFVTIRPPERVKAEVAAAVARELEGVRPEEIEARVRALVNDADGVGIAFDEQYASVWTESLQLTDVVYSRARDTLVIHRADEDHPPSLYRPCFEDSEFEANLGAALLRGGGPTASPALEPIEYASFAGDAADAVLELVWQFRLTNFIPVADVVPGADNVYETVKARVGADFLTRVLGRAWGAAGAPPLLLSGPRYHGKYTTEFLHVVWRQLRGFTGAARPPRVAVLAKNSNMLAPVLHVFRARGWPTRGGAVEVFVTAPSNMSVFDVGGGVRRTNLGPYLDAEAVEAACSGQGRAASFDLVIVDTGVHNDGRAALRDCLAAGVVAARLLRRGGRAVLFLNARYLLADARLTPALVAPLALFGGGDEPAFPIASPKLRYVVAEAAGFRPSAAAGAVGALTAAFRAACDLRVPESELVAGHLAPLARALPRGFVEGAVAKIDAARRAVVDACAAFVRDPRPLFVKAREEAGRVHADLAATYGRVPGFAVPDAEQLFALWLRLREVKMQAAAPPPPGPTGGAGRGGKRGARGRSATKEKKKNKKRGGDGEGAPGEGGLDASLMVVRRSAHKRPSVAYPPVRRLDHDAAPRLRYDPDLLEAPPRCHWGQRKLFFSEVEFLTAAFAELRAPPAEFCAVYVGAASGEHLAALLPLFPGLAWQLYDGAPFRVAAPALAAAAGADVQLFSGPKQGFFRDATVALALRRARAAGRRRILFISDIRLDPADEAVFRDMRLQERWGVALGAERMLLKFRLPFQAGEGWTEDASAPGVAGAGASIRRRLPAAVPANRAVTYLDGDILFQVYARMQSAEARLLVRRGAQGGAAYSYREYDIVAYQEQMMYFNEMVRDAAHVLPGGTLLSWHLPGMDNGYEAAVEYLVAERWLALNGRGEAAPPPRRVLEALREWGAALTAATGGRRLDDCEARTLAAYSEKAGESAVARRRAKLWLRYLADARPNVAREQARILRAVGAAPLGGGPAGGRAFPREHYEAEARRVVEAAAADGRPTQKKME